MTIARSLKGKATPRAHAWRRGPPLYHRILHRLIAFAVPLLLNALPASAEENALEMLQEIPGLVGLWDFREQAGSPRVSIGTPQAHALREIGGTIPRREDGPLSGFSAWLDGRTFFSIPHDQTGDLNISGREAQMSMVAFVKLQRISRGVTIAGMWSEGSGAHDDSGVRQYSLLLHMPLYGGAKQVTPHISASGGVSVRQDGSKLPWCVDFAASRSQVELDRWVSLGFTYDGTWIRAFYNGECEPRNLEPQADRRADRYFTKEGPDGDDRGMNPYYQPGGIFTFEPGLPGKQQQGAPFTVGARQALGRQVAEPLHGQIAGLAVFNRALSNELMWRIHAAVLPETAAEVEPGQE